MTALRDRIRLVRPRRRADDFRSAHPISPSATWNGTAGTGFGVGNPAPTDPSRTAAKPAAHFLIPPNQTFTDELFVLLDAYALVGDTLIGGIDRVRFHFEGNRVDVVQVGLHTIVDANGVSRVYEGYAVRLRKPPLVGGAALLYAEVIPADANMQNRVISMTVYPRASQFEGTLTLAPSQPVVVGSSYQTMNAALNYIRQQAWNSSRIIVAETGTYNITPVTPTYTPASYCIVDTADGVTATWGKAALSHSDRTIRSRFDRLWFRGDGHVFDFANYSFFQNEGTGAHVFDGVTITDSNGRETLYLGGDRWDRFRFQSANYFLECDVSEVADVFNNALLVRGGTTDRTYQDLAKGARCIIGLTVTDHDSSFYRTNQNAFTVQYTGAASTATVAMTGVSNSDNRTITLKENGSTVATLTVGYFPQDVTDNTFSVEDVVNWINAQSGWEAILADPPTQRRATTLTLQGTVGFGAFGDTDAKTAPLQMVTAIDHHSDFYQANGGTQENIIVANCRVRNFNAQLIHLKEPTALRDAMFVNLGLFQEGEEIVFANLNCPSSHVVLAHISINQTMRMRTSDGATFDGRCAVMNNVANTIAWDGTPDADLIIKDNHTFGGTAPSGATGHTTGGDASTLFVDAANGDFSPAGALLDNLKPRAVKRDLNRKARAASDAAGAVAT